MDFEVVGPIRAVETMAVGPAVPDVSSTEVRARVRRGEPIDRLVPAKVADYIEAHALYRGPARGGESAG